MNEIRLNVDFLVFWFAQNGSVLSTATHFIQQSVRVHPNGVEVHVADNQ